MASQNCSGSEPVARPQGPGMGPIPIPEALALGSGVVTEPEAQHPSEGCV